MEKIKLPLLVFVATLALATAGCAKKAKPDGQGNEGMPSNSVQDSTIHDSDSQNANGLTTVHFAYDSDVLNAQAKKILNSNAQVLKENPRMYVQIEGHCDQRGGTQYNLALGERRAHMVQKYLGVMGVDAARITTISMGKEKPLDPAETEEAYAKNRRGNFVITQQ